jgi:hypothetical protein
MILIQNLMLLHRIIFEIILYEEGREWDIMFYDNIGAAMRYVKSVGAIKKAA